MYHGVLSPHDGLYLDRLIVKRHAFDLAFCIASARAPQCLAVMVFPTGTSTSRTCESRIVLSTDLRNREHAHDA